MARRSAQHWPTRAGAIFFGLIGISFVVYLAYRGTNANHPPTTKEVIALTTFSAIAQIVAAYMWSLVGRVHPSHARSAVRRLVRVHLRTRQFADSASQAYEFGTPDERRLELGRISSGLDILADQIEDGISDWQEFHINALNELLEPTPEGPGND